MNAFMMTVINDGSPLTAALTVKIKDVKIRLQPLLLLYEAAEFLLVELHLNWLEQIGQRAFDDRYSGSSEEAVKIDSRALKTQAHSARTAVCTLSMNRTVNCMVEVRLS